MAGLLAEGISVHDGPPLSRNAPSSGLVPLRSPVAVSGQVASLLRLWPSDTMAPLQFLGLPPANRVLTRTAGASEPSNKLPFDANRPVAVLLTMVSLVSVRLELLLTYTPPVLVALLL